MEEAVEAAAEEVVVAVRHLQLLILPKSKKIKKIKQGLQLKKLRKKETRQNLKDSKSRLQIYRFQLKKQTRVKTLV